MMATSSILTNFTITDREAAENFANALESASKESEWQPTIQTKPPLISHEEIRALFAKRKKYHEY